MSKAWSFLRGSQRRATMRLTPKQRAFLGALVEQRPAGSLTVYNPEEALRAAYTPPQVRYYLRALQKLALLGTYRDRIILSQEALRLVGVSNEAAPDVEPPLIDETLIQQKGVVILIDAQNVWNYFKGAERALRAIRSIIKVVSEDFGAITATFAFISARAVNLAQMFADEGFFVQICPVISNAHGDRVDPAVIILADAFSRSENVTDIILVSGDKHFAEMVRRVQARGKPVTVVSYGPVAKDLAAAASNIIELEEDDPKLRRRVVRDLLWTIHSLLTGELVYDDDLEFLSAVVRILLEIATERCGLSFHNLVDALRGTMIVRGLKGFSREEVEYIVKLFLGLDDAIPEAEIPLLKGVVVRTEEGGDVKIYLIDETHPLLRAMQEAKRET